MYFNYQKLIERNSKNVVHHFKFLFLYINKFVDKCYHDVKMFIKHVSRIIIINDNQFNNDVVHVSRIIIINDNQFNNDVVHVFDFLKIDFLYKNCKSN